jgi:hypothetical protein
MRGVALVADSPQIADALSAQDGARGIFDRGEVADSSGDWGSRWAGVASKRGLAPSAVEPEHFILAKGNARFQI